ncbi:MAG: response regulator [Ktedonobacteraceae bacterium]|nr:response regulator [Ktedonobacteraceae bacterium]
MQAADALPASLRDTPEAHDHLMQMLSEMLIQLNALQSIAQTGVPADDRTALDRNAISGGLAELERMTRALIHEVRTASEDSMPLELEDTTLAEALSQIIEETAESQGFSSRVAFSGEEQTLSSVVKRLLYRVAREALYQVQSHTGTRKLRLALTYGRADVQMSIEDDGVPPSSEDEALAPPFTQPAPATAAVFNDLRLRVEHLGGGLEVGTQGEQGTRVLVHIPYAQHPQSTPASPSMQPEVKQADRIRLLIVEGQAVTRAGLRRLLESYADLQIVGEAADGIQGVSETLELGPQVVLMDMQLPGDQSLEALRQIKQLNLDTRVLMFSSQNREEYLYETLRAGAAGYILKDITPDELAQAVRTVARGEVLVQAQLAGQMLSRFGKQARGGHPQDTLTAREQEVLRLLARGLRNKEIAARLYVSERTVNFHLANIYQKLNVSGRTEALSRAIEQGLITT